MISTEPQYWADYAHMPTKTVVEAVQLTQPTLIDGKTYESGDWSVKTNGGCIGMRSFEFDRDCRKIEQPEEKPRFDKGQAMLEKIDDLIVQTAMITAALERQGIIQDPAQK